MNNFFKKLKQFFVRLIAPNEIKCLVCGKDIFDDVGFCEDCLKDVPFNNGKTCKRCGVAIHGEEDYCSNCAFDKVYFDKAYSVFGYDGVTKKLIHDLKFHNHAYITKTFARYLVYLAEKHNVEYDIVCAVPMTKKSLKKRGYNQSKLLAMYFCDILQKDCFADALSKIKETEPQEHLGKTERKQNLIGAYSADKTLVKGKRVLLIDDVKTTGATLNECAKTLKKAGATAVNCITVCSREEKFNYESEEEI